MNGTQQDYGRRVRRMSGFTLMEMVIVIAIIALLAGIAAPALMKNFHKGQVAAAKSSIKVFTDSVKAYIFDTGVTPASLNELFTNSGSAKKWHGPYIENYAAMPKDPWGNDYIYNVKGGGDFEIISYGMDGQPGGEGFNGDITYMQD